MLARFVSAVVCEGSVSNLDASDGEPNNRCRLSPAHVEKDFGPCSTCNQSNAWHDVIKGNGAHQHTRGSARGRFEKALLPRCGMERISVLPFQKIKSIKYKNHAPKCSALGGGVKSNRDCASAAAAADVAAVTFGM